VVSLHVLTAGVAGVGAGGGADGCTGVELEVGPLGEADAGDGMGVGLALAAADVEGGALAAAVAGVDDPPHPATSARATRGSRRMAAA